MAIQRQWTPRSEGGKDEQTRALISPEAMRPDERVYPKTPADLADEVEANLIEEKKLQEKKKAAEGIREMLKKNTK